VNNSLDKTFVSGILLLLLFLITAVVSCEDNSVSVIPDDGWEVSRPEAQGLDSALLATLTGRINDGDYGEIHSLLIVRHGYLVYERYFNGYNSETLHPMYSVTKSVTSILIGVAIDQRKLTGIDKPLLSLFPDYLELQNLDSNKRAITVEDVLMMQAGFQWSESYSVSQMAKSGDWLKFMLDLPVVNVPGTQFHYNSGCSILLAGIIRNTSHLEASEFADRYLFGQLGITRKRWDDGPGGLTNTAGGLFLRPRDMARIGLLYLQEGVWKRKIVVSSSWVDESTSWLTDASTGVGYGYQWWTMSLEDTGEHPQAGEDEIKFASGAGDQYIFVIPSLDLVVTTTANNTEPPYDRPIAFLRQYIVPAIKQVE
jgi:CubicO group peptidase (beta-lactamase class C family)